MQEEAKNIDAEILSDEEGQDMEQMMEDVAPLNEADVTAAEAYAQTQEAAPDWQGKALRAMAEIENLRKRQTKELADAKQFALMGFAREMLTVADNMERALAAMNEDGADLVKMQEGVEMVAGQLKSTFEKFQVKKLESIGEKLNPELHQVMMEVEDSAAEAGTVVQELQAGYTIGERLLRPALVGTAKSPAATGGE